MDVRVVFISIGNSKDVLERIASWSTYLGGFRRILRMEDTTAIIDSSNSRMWVPGMRTGYIIILMEQSCSNANIF